MSIRSSRPRAGDTASQLWASSPEVRELVDLLDPRSQTELAALVSGFFGTDGQLFRIMDNQLSKFKGGELLALSDTVTSSSVAEAPACIDDAEPLSGNQDLPSTGPSPGALFRHAIDFGSATIRPAPVADNDDSDDVTDL